MFDHASDTRLRASPDCAVRDVAGETVLLNLRNGTYYGLDAIGTLVWRKLEDGASLTEIVTHLHDRTGADPSRIEADMRRFLGDLLQNNLIDIAQGSTG